ncbi:EF-hand domain-containing protein [Sphingomonas xinjiangensis]|uniref:EF-hand domain-containing protein n=1 Tax=Sphingomonas xinjiangensis TaxID=643568 RepID=A0A840YE05_9SPHN|nr:hypothetical protein [Sphingomonas xinjiangensis]MBB5709018.1 hypothetical protein [Sphingomonas xinjiangensis]
MKKPIHAALLGATLLAGNAQAAGQQTPQHPGPTVKVDSNGDGLVTRQEALAAADMRFAMHDANKDGQLSAEERRAGKRHRMHKPGIPHANKHAAFRQQMLERFDTNKDGALSDAERESAREARRAKRAEHRGHAPAGEPLRIDTDGNGLVSPAEMRAAAQARFDRTDTNHDGRIDAGERDAAHVKRKAMHAHGRGSAVPAAAPR